MHEDMHFGSSLWFSRRTKGLILLFQALVPSHQDIVQLLNDSDELFLVILLKCLLASMRQRTASSSYITRL